ncbi:hypothetical protein NFI00_000048 [Salmonella enterica]|nr:hypothetical protein [Salmonella enterica]
MNFPIVQQYKFDIDGTNPENKVDNEPITTPAGIWNRIIVPVNGPFFVDSLELTLPNGKPLVEEEDYRIFRMMGKLSEFCAKDVACIIELIKPEITDVLATYQVVGDTTLFDRGMLLLIMDAVNDDRPVWWDNVLNKPPAFPPILHGHSLIYEIVAFQDMVAMIDELISYLNNGHRDLLELKIDHITTLIDWYIDLYTKTLRNYLERHKAAYNAHGLTAEQANADLIDNYATATTTQALQGERNDLVIKPSGLKALMQEYGYNSEFYLETNIIPLSRYGSRTFIPPTIDGNFEGLGSQIEAAGMCMEPDGSITYLSNHFDGRTEGIYFSVCPNYQQKLELNYTGYKYTHPKIAADGINVNRVVHGSNHEVIMVGRPGTAGWYLGLSKGTFNPSKHVLSKVDMSPLVADLGSTDYRHQDQLSVHLMGSWIYLIQTYSGDAGPNSRKRFYRIPASAVEQGSSVTPARVKLTYVNWDGKQFTNNPEFVFAERFVNAAGRVTRCVFNFNPPTDNADNWLYRSSQTITTKVPNKANAYVLKMLSYYWTPYSNGAINSTLSGTVDIVYEFNPDTAVFTLLSKLPEPPSINMENGGPFNIDQYSGNKSGYITANWARQSAVVLPTGDILYSSSSLFSYPYAMNVFRTGYRTAYESLKLAWTIANFPGLSYQQAVSLPISPLLSSVQQAGLTYDQEGELYVANPQSSTSDKYSYHRTVTGDYAKREGITNINYPNLLSRPLGGTIKRVMIVKQTPKINITGTATQISKYGLNLGFTTFGMGSQKRFFNRAQNATWTDGTNDEDVMLVTQHTKRDNGDGTLSIVPQRQILWPAAVVNQLFNQLIPAAYKDTPDKAITIMDFSDAAEARFGSFPAIVVLNYVDKATATARALFATVRPTYSALTGIRRTVTGYSILVSTEIAIRTTQNDINNWQLRPYGGWYTTPATHVYLKDDGTFDIAFWTGLASQHNGNSGCACGVFNITKANGAINSGYLYSDEENIRAARPMIPKVGLGEAQVWNNSSGGSAYIALSGGNYYMLASCYPESGWIIYFQKEQEVVFNGVLYTLPVGTMDLRDVDPSPQNKTFYLYTLVSGGKAIYKVSAQKLEDTPFQMWIGTIKTNEKQILTLERFNVFTLNGKRVSEVRRGSAIPASSGVINSDGQIPWLRPSEIIQG